MDLDLDLDLVELDDGGDDNNEASRAITKKESSKDDNGRDDDDETKQEKETLMKNLHKVLFDLHVVEGHLVCPDTKRRFPISMGIPNMILHEDEI